MTVRLEACVDSTEGMLAAVRGGADRIELCAALEVGGLTPSAGQMRRAASLEVPVHALIRSRAGDFRFGPDEVTTMLDDIRAAKAAGLAGAVIGASLADGRLDRDTLARMKEAAGTMSVTLHRAFDLVPDFAEAVETAVSLGLDRILTSGGAVGAPGGTEVLRSVIGMAAGRIGVLPAAGITSANVAQLLAEVPVPEVHSACDGQLPLDPRAVALGFGQPMRTVTSEAEVRAIKAVLATLG